MSGVSGTIRQKGRQAKALSSRSVSSLVLGTAQWGMKYGIAGSGQMAATEVARVLRKAAEAGVELLDTAPAYGESESVIGKISLREPVGGVVTKVAVDAVSAADVRSSCLKSLERLRRTSLYGLLVHRTNSLLELNGCEIWKELEALKEEGKVERIGVSVYSPQEMSVLLDKFPLDMIQVPLSVLDQRMIRSNLLKKAKDRGVEIHARSVFLQGILLMDEHSIPKHLSGLIESVQLFRLRSSLGGASCLASAISFVRQQKEVDRIVIGIDSMKHFIEIINAFDCILDINFSDLEVRSLDLIDPRKWID